MSDTNQARDRVERIKNAVGMTQLLSDLGYDVTPGGHDQQFPCDLHGGNDDKPSARTYDDSRAYCFACAKQRDQVTWVMDRNGIDFNAACLWLENQYGLSRWQYTGKKPDADAQTSEVVIPDLPDISKQALDWDRESKRVQALITGIWEDRSVPWEQVYRWWEAHDMIHYRCRGKTREDRELRQKNGAKYMVKLREKIMKEVLE